MSSKTLGVCLIGAGRIGAVHAQNVGRLSSARLVVVADVDVSKAHRLADPFGAAVVGSPAEAIRYPGVEAVVVASPTNTHVDVIRASAEAGRAIFCEKPIDLELERVDEALAGVAQAGVPFFVGFNRRFDPGFRKIKADVARGRIGSVETLSIVSRDPEPPPAAYVRVSGGLFKDMMIHDFDMACWILGDQPVEVYASASALVSEEIGALGDVDTAMVVMRMPSGALCHIGNSRRACYGYDQRLEVFGSRGMLRAENPPRTQISHHGSDGVWSEKPPHFFLERYEDAYRKEMEVFVEGVLRGDDRSFVGAGAGRSALVLAQAAMRSLEEHRAVSVAR